VRLREWTEHLGPLGVLVQSIGVIDRMPGLMTQKHHGHGAILDLSGLFFFDQREALVSEVKRNADDRHLVWTSPTIRQIELRPKADSLGFQLAIEPLSMCLQRRAVDLEMKVADARVEEFVSDRLPTVDKSPGLCGAHSFLV